MGSLEDDVRELILDRNRSLAEFAREIGLPEHTLYSALSNGLTGATLATVAPIAKALDLDLAEFAQGRATPAMQTNSSVLVPLFGSIAAGKPAEPADAEDVFPIPRLLHEAYPDAFMLRVEGASMDRILPNGWYALVDPCNTVDTSGEMYVVAVGTGAATVKHVRLLNNGLELLPDSNDPTFHPMLFDYADSDAERIRIIGRVVWYCPPVMNAAHLHR